MLGSSVTPFPLPRHMAQQAREDLIRQSLEALGEAIGRIGQMLAGERVVPYASWPHQLRFECESQAASALARLDKDKRRQARLRCREQVALQLYGRDFSMLSSHDQNRIIQQVQVIVGTYDLTLEGRIEPLPIGCSRRAELEPEAVRVDGRAS